MAERVRVFSSGFEYTSWLERNCELPCPKSGACDLENALWYGAASDGTLAPEIAERLGYRATLGWPCKERLGLVEGQRPAAGEMRDAGAPLLPGLDDKLIRSYEASLRPLSWVRAHLFGWPAVLAPHEAQVRPAGESVYAQVAEGM